jgi:hypothetical protein
MHRYLVCFVLAMGVAACGSNAVSGNAGRGAPGDASVALDAGAAADGNRGPTPDGSPSTDDGASPSSSDAAIGTTYEGGAAPPDSGLPPLPPLSHVQALVRGNSARITFDPYPNAKDYRVYVMPQASDVLVDGNGNMVGVQNGTYRCAGERAAPEIIVDNDQGPGPQPVPQDVFTNTYVNGVQVGSSYARTTADATLGYAFEDPTPGTVPVYAVGDPGMYADNYLYGVREPQTRSKLYVLDKSTYLAQGWRDDGVVFYAPSDASSEACRSSAPVQIATKDVALSQYTTHLLFPAASAEAAALGGGKPAFFVCPNPAAGAQPVMRVNYQVVSGEGHDEIVLGNDAFGRARCQASAFDVCAEVPQSPWQVHWANIQGRTQLVVEALDQGCPFEGLIGPDAVAPASAGDATTEPLTTMALVRASAPHGEVFLNGEFDGTTPHPIARSVVTVSPASRPAMDFASDFANAPQVFTEVLNPDGSNDCGEIEALTSVGEQNLLCCGGCQGNDHHYRSADYDMLARQGAAYSFGVVEGELWSFLGGGSVRLAPRNIRASVTSSSYLHVVLEASSFTTDRRYPQIIVSQQDLLTSQWLLADSNDTNPAVQPVLILQPFDQGDKTLEIQLCNGRPWDVNNQCPSFQLEKLDPTPGQQSATARFTPHPELFDHLQDDDSARYDLYLSTEKAYVLFEGQPYGCVDLVHRTMIDSAGAAITPATQSPAGTVTVAFGTVLYHAAAQGSIYQMMSRFHMSHEFASDLKHFDYFAFKSGEAAPAWDESRFPCLTQMHQGAIPNEGP